MLLVLCLEFLNDWRILIKFSMNTTLPDTNTVLYFIISYRQ
jgi:hypothetical protein